MTTPEAKARKEIDKQLLATGWILQNISDMNIMAGVGVAVREFPLTTGEADDALYIDGKVVITTIHRLYSMLQGDEEFDPQNEEQSFYEDDLMGGSTTMSVCEKPVGYNQQVRSTVFRRNPGTIPPEGGTTNTSPLKKKAIRKNMKALGFELPVGGKK